MSEYSIFMGWLKKQPPIMWYYVVSDWSEWDGDNEPIHWIVDQVTCERHTALEVIVKCNPWEMIDYPTEYAFSQYYRSSSALDTYRLVRKIIRQWKKGYYQDYSFGHNGLPLSLQELQNETIKSRQSFKFLPEMFEAVDGPKRLPDAIMIDKANRELADLGLKFYANGNLLTK